MARTQNVLGQRTWSGGQYQVSRLRRSPIFITRSISFEWSFPSLLVP